MADVLYIWLFAMLGVNAFVIVLALAHATNERPTHKRSYVMRRCRKLVACCSTAVSIILLLAGSLFVASVDFGAARTTRSFAYRLSMLIDQSTRKDFASVLRQAASQNLRSVKGGDPAHLKLGTGTIAAGVIPPSALDARSSAIATGSLPAPRTKSPSKEASRSDVVWLFDQQEGPSLFASSDRGATVTGS